MSIPTNGGTATHEFRYDAVNQPKEYLPPLHDTAQSGVSRSLYDLDGRLEQLVYPSGRTTGFVYENGRLKTLNAPEGPIGYTYLPGGRPYQISRNGKTITHLYSQELLTTQRLEWINNAALKQLNYLYNNDFDVEYFTYAGVQEHLQYDDDGLLTGEGLFTLARDPDNGVVESVSDGAFTATPLLTGFGELESVDYTVGNVTGAGFTLHYDNLGRIDGKTETFGGQTIVYAYLYDELNRLKTVQRDTGGGLQTVEDYTYDANGNRITEENTLRGVDRGYTHSDEDHLLSAGDVDYAYDQDGFLATKTDGSDVTTYTYSTLGELLAVELPDTTQVTYDHDPIGRRIAKYVDGALVERYLWQGRTQLLAVFDASERVLQRFEYAGGRMPVAMRQWNGSTYDRYYLLYDQVGSLRAIVNPAGTAVKLITYDSFGSILSETNSAFTIPFGFAGGLHDRDTGLVRFGFRDYDPELGRWTAKDPIGFMGRDSNLYVYVGSNPVSFADPHGTLGPVIVAIGAAVWGLIETGLSFFDVADTAATVLDPGASTSDKAISVVGLAAGTLLPGGGYGATAKAAKGGIGPVLKGQAGVKQAIKELESGGAEIVGREITLEAGGVRTRLDLISRTGNELEFVEVKNGACSSLTANQRKAIPIVQEGGAVPWGQNAADAGLAVGAPMPPTPVTVIRYP